MNRLRNRLIVIFLAATLAPWAATLWITSNLLEHSLRYRPTGQLDEISKSLEKTGREYYQQAREDLKAAAAAGRVTPQHYAERDRGAWPDRLQNFWSSGETERVILAGEAGDRLDYLVRRPGEALIYSRPLAVPMNRLLAQYQRARELVNAEKDRDLRRGFIYTWLLLASSIWLASLVILGFLAHRISRPIQQLTGGLSELASGNFAVRLKGQRDDEIGRAIEAFNDTAGQLEQNRDRLIYLTQLASWQTLARKMAHEVKNSLTPIRLTVEEMVARHAGVDRGFLEQAAQIVAEEVESLERRVRAFSQFSAEPPVLPRELDLNALVEDRVAFLQSGHPEVSYQVRPADESPRALADEDLVKGILVNLLENAAEAAGSGGNVLAITHVSNGRVSVEIHDSGPGLSEQARRTLFQPTISFKKNGMGLGLSIARKSALLSGGDILAVPGELGGAGFRLELPNSSHGHEKILIVDDEDNIGRSLRMILEREGHAVSICHSVAEFRAHPDAQRADAYLFDMRLPDGSGIDLLRSLDPNDGRAPSIMISGHGTIADAVEATRAGAFDFLEKPLSREKVLVALKNALEHASLRRENERLRELVGTGPKMIGASPAYLRAVEQASMAARSDARVLLIGESGTGKELLAEHIHRGSPFAAGAFVKVNCAAIPTELLESELFGHEKGAFTGAAGMRRGKFELADGGTLFLDEIGDLHGASQAKLLRVLQEGEFHRVGGEQTIRVSVRVISATNRDLGSLVAQEKFREDLYYRVSVVPIRVPALRERPQDIRPLAEYFLEEFCARNNFKPKAIADDVFPALESYPWPGNARELRNAIERMAILSSGDRLTRDAIPVEIRVQRDSGQRTSVQEARASAERDYILRALEEASWNVSGAARALGMERTNLHKRIRALGLTREK